MAATVWLLVQLHQAEAIHFYRLPSKPPPFTHPPNQPASLKPGTPPANMTDNGGNCDGMHGGSSAAADKEDGKDGDGVEVAAVGVIELTGLSVDVGIVVVLSWAAQLASLQDTAVVIKGNSVTFSLGKFCMPLLARAASCICKFSHSWQIVLQATASTCPSLFTFKAITVSRMPGDKPGTLMV